MLLGLVEAAAQALSGQQWLEKCSVQELGFHICFTAALLLFWVYKCVKMNPNMTPAPPTTQQTLWMTSQRLYVDPASRGLSPLLVWVFCQLCLSRYLCFRSTLFPSSSNILMPLFCLQIGWENTVGCRQRPPRFLLFIYFFSVFQFPTLFVVTATCSICLTYAVFLFLSLSML